MAKKLSGKKNASATRMATRKKTRAKKSVSAGALFSMKLVYFLLALTGLAAIIYGYIWFDKHYQPTEDLMPIKVLKIQGNLQQVSRDQIVARLLQASGAGEEEKRQGYIGFLGTDLQFLEQQLEQLPWIQRAELRRVWPDQLYINLKEQKAIARWNEQSLVNEYGEAFTPETLEGTEALPKLKGPEQELSLLLQTFQELQQTLSGAELNLDVLTLNHRYAWSMELTNGIQLQVGRKHLMERVERFVTLYPLLKSESEAPIATVDLRYDTGLAVMRLDTTTLQASL